MKQVKIYTDGACSGNPGKGGWGAVLIYGKHEKQMSGGEKETTNNRMELTAVIEALSALKEPCEVTLTTDSSYICNAINEGWLDSWIGRNWKKADNKPVLNVDLWQRLFPLLSKHKIEFVWIKGHDGNYYNEICDRLAVNEYKNME